MDWFKRYTTQVILIIMVATSSCQTAQALGIDWNYWSECASNRVTQISSQIKKHKVGVSLMVAVAIAGFAYLNNRAQKIVEDANELLREIETQRKNLEYNLRSNHSCGHLFDEGVHELVNVSTTQLDYSEYNLRLGSFIKDLEKSWVQFLVPGAAQLLKECQEMKKVLNTV